MLRVIQTHPIYLRPLADKDRDMEGTSKNGETGPQRPLWSRTRYTTKVLLLQPSWGRSDTFHGV